MYMYKSSNYLKQLSIYTHIKYDYYLLKDGKEEADKVLVVDVYESDQG